MTFDKLVIWIWNREFFWRNVWCTIKEEGVIGNVFLCTCYLNGKWLKNLYVFCEFYLL
jgi:hypothetical protein